MLSKSKGGICQHLKGRRERMATRSSLGSLNIGGKISSNSIVHKVTSILAMPNIKAVYALMQAFPMLPAQIEPS